MAEADNPNVLVFPPFAALAALLAAIVLEWLFPLHILPPPFPLWMTLAGALLTLASVAVAALGVQAFMQAGTNVDPRQPALKITTTGPYRFTRNPMYLGMIGIQFGLALTFSLDWAIFGGTGLILVLHYGVVLREETYLTKKFGAPYTGFKSRTRRWL